MLPATGTTRDSNGRTASRADRRAGRLFRGANRRSHERIDNLLNDFRSVRVEERGSRSKISVERVTEIWLSSEAWSKKMCGEPATGRVTRRSAGRGGPAGGRTS